MNSFVFDLNDESSIERLYQIVKDYFKKSSIGYNSLGYDEDDFIQDTVISLYSILKNQSNVNESLIKRCIKLKKYEIFRKFYYKKNQVNNVGFQDIETIANIIESENNELDDVECKSLIDDFNSTLSKIEKKIFKLMLKGFEVKEIGEILNLSDKMIYVYKKRICEKYKKFISSLEK